MFFHQNGMILETQNRKKLGKNTNVEIKEHVSK